MRITGIIARTDHTGTTDGTMRAAIVSDVHSNLAALEAVLAHAESLNALDQIWALGDLVGYGPQPSECLAMLRQYDFRSVAGNHDLAVAGAIDTSDFNPAAATANHWNADRIGDDEREYLRTLPQNLTIDGISLVHGSLRDPVWEYMYSIDAAVAQFANMETRFSLVGHTHVPLVFEEALNGQDPDYRQIDDGETIELGDRRLILNPGGVGQPRDGDPRSAYAVYDSDARTLAFYRVPYDIERTQALMAEAGLPARLISRLSRGR
jgi:diadenosine tetraphosphatase ApaH/serine/threonine PP2A family protein phosphatase